MHQKMEKSAPFFQPTAHLHLYLQRLLGISSVVRDFAGLDVPGRHRGVEVDDPFAEHDNIHFNMDCGYMKRPF
jgi:hypothetical protein